MIGGGTWVPAPHVQHEAARVHHACSASPAAPWPLAAYAQQAEQIGESVSYEFLAASDPEALPRIAAFMQGLQEAAWKVGHNLRIDHRWAEGDTDRRREQAAQLIALRPDAILASGASTVAPLQQGTRSIPIVFVQVTDPVGAGFVAGLAKPGGTSLASPLSNTASVLNGWNCSKRQRHYFWRVAVLRDPSIATGIGLFGADAVGRLLARDRIEPGRRA